jgi:hypothetical protein
MPCRAPASSRCSPGSSLLPYRADWRRYVPCSFFARVVTRVDSSCRTQELQNPAVNTLFNLCRLSKSRQDAAAAAGVIPLLQKIVHDNSPLKQFALPILCDFAHASRACRRRSAQRPVHHPGIGADFVRACRLWAHDGVAFYVRLLKDPFWVNPALEAVAAWCVSLRFESA